MYKPLQIIISPSNRAFEKYKPRGLFSDFYGIWMMLMALLANRKNELGIRNFESIFTITPWAKKKMIDIF